MGLWFGRAMQAARTKTMDVRDDLIRETVAGKTFVDVGGLWGTINEKVSVAAAAGAGSVAMIDITPLENELWTLLDERLASLGVSDYERISADIEKLGKLDDRPLFDVVHCSGVLYHHPEPLQLIRSLRKITRRHLILTSAITQERVENDLGVFQIPASGVLFVPALPESERKILAKYWTEHAGASAWGITERVTWNLEDFAPWWHLPTAHSMAAMAEVCGLKLISSHPIWNGDAQTLLLEVV
jgi:2-polyprenyl-3-methyl-5-hydroxy-6-metoxy-1,4-benzoquinol methylase